MGVHGLDMRPELAARSREDPVRRHHQRVRCTQPPAVVLSVHLSVQMGVSGRSICFGHLQIQRNILPVSLRLLQRDW